MDKNGLTLLYNLYFRKYRFKIIIILFILLIGTATSLYQYGINRYLIDEIIAKKEYSVFPNFLALFVLLSFICLFLSWIVERANLAVSQKCSIDMRTDLLRKVHSSRFKDVLNISTAAISVRIMEDVAYVNSFFNNVVVGNISIILTIICMSVYVCTYSPLYYLMILIPAIIQMMIMHLFAGKIKENQQNARTVTQEHLNLLTRNMRCLPLVKAFSIQKQLMTDYYECLKKISWVTIKNFDVEYIAKVSLSVISILGDVVLLYTGAKKVMDGSLSMGSFVAIIGVGYSLKNMFSELASINIQWQKIKVSAERIIDIINIESEGKNKELKDDHKIEKITFDDVTFSYSDTNSAVLNGFNMEFTNELPYIIKGASGKGKSTVLNLIMQNIDVSEGEIIANDYYSFKDNNMRKRVAVCYQDDMFAFDTIYDNLLRSDEGEITENNVIEALDISEASGFISKLANGLNTKIDEILSNLSGGEIKRISIARTLLKQADIYIFDESFSCIDEETRLRIFEKVIRKLNGKIVIVISHDDLFERLFDVKTVYI